MTERLSSIATLILRNSSKGQGIVKPLEKVQLLHRLFVFFFVVSVASYFLATEALAINSSHAQIYGYNSDFTALLFSAIDSDPTHATLPYAPYNQNTFSAEATGTANGYILGVEGRADVGINFSDHLFTTASGNFRDVITFTSAQDAILHLSYLLTGASWRNTSYAYSINALEVIGLLVSGDGSTFLGRDTDLFFPPASITSDPSSAFLIVSRGSLQMDSVSSPGTPYMIAAGTPYTLSLSLASTIAFHPYFDPSCFCYSGYANVSGGFDFLHTLTLTDLYLTDMDGTRVPFSYSSSEGVTYPTSGSVPEPGTLALLGLGLAGLAATRRRKQ